MRGQAFFPLLLLCLLAALPAQAQSGSLLYEYAIVRTTNAPTKNVLDAAAWQKEISAGKHQVLASGSVTGRLNEEAYGMVGHKVPLTYYDPRAEMAQVQYIDEGFKVDCKAKPATDGRFRLEFRFDQVKLVRSGQNLEESDQFRAEGATLLKRGQTAIVGSSNGALTSTFLGSSFPDAPLGEDATVLFTLTVR